MLIDTLLLRKKILDIAIQGRLTRNNENDLAPVIPDMGEEISLSEMSFEIPSNWRWSKIGWVLDIERGGSPRPIKAFLTTAENGINWIKIGDVEKNGKYICSTKEKIIPEGEKKSKRVFPGDFLLTNSMSFGRPYISKIEGCVHDGWLILRNTHELFYFDFLYYVLSSQYAYNQFCKKASGSTVDNLNIDKVADAVVPIPPIEQQKRIVASIEEALSYVDVIDELQTRYIDDFEILKSKVIDAGIQGKLTEQFSEDGIAEELYAEIQEEKTKLIKEKQIKKEKVLAEIDEDEIPFEIPNNWKWVRLGDICSKISSGNTPAGGSKGGAYVSEGFCFLREQNIYNDGIRNDGMVYITEELLNKRINSTVLPKDILLNITGGSIGRCALIPDDFTRGSINQHILIIRVVNPRIRFYVHKCLCSPYYQKLIMGNVVGDKDGFSAGRCKNTLIPLPPYAEQLRIVDKIDELLSLI